LPDDLGEMDCFSPGAVCLVLASKLYDETDYWPRIPDKMMQAVIHEITSCLAML
jgi:hypothetical protein